jgi:NAD(P)-dependent dehydrogenase (short-subunit alcohol dehydrogenase family)
MTREANPQRRVALITGASSGIGRVTARDLAAQGDVVVTVSRAGGAGAEVAAALRQETGGEVHHLAADLSSVRAARGMVAAFRERWSRLDVLVCNAGAYFAQRRETAEGFELTWALNHLGVAAPAILMADLLVASAPSRVVITSSNAAQATRLRWDDLQRRRYSGMGAYAQSKLANQVFTMALASRLAGSGVSVHAMHPGFVATEFGAEAGPLTGFVRLTQRLFGRSPERGADTLTFLARDPVALATSGLYWVDRRQLPMAPGAREAGAADRLWRVTLEQLGLAENELSAALQPTPRAA